MNLYRLRKYEKTVGYMKIVMEGTVLLKMSHGIKTLGDTQAQ